MAVITISGNLGSGAIDIGRLVAHRAAASTTSTGEILTEAARTLGVSERAIAGRDDSSPPPTCARDSPPSSRTSSSARPSPAPPTP